jgi:hypothetical protein
MKYESVRSHLPCIAEKFAAFARRDDGSIAVAFALSAVVVIGAAGVAIDLSRFVHAHSALQGALDTAVLAGARADEGSQLAAANTAFKVNFTDKNAKDKGVKDVSVTFNPLGEGQFSGTATGYINTTLAGILGVKRLDLDLVSRAKGVGGGTVSRVCIIALDPTASQALLVNSGADVNAPDCEAHVKSRGNPAAVFNAGTKLITQRICIAGKNILDNGGTHPNVEKECVTSDNPFAGKLTSPTVGSCTSMQPINGGSVTLNPGVYCGLNFNNAPKVKFNPGVYIVKSGDWNVNGGEWTGTGVTFYFADTSKIQLNSQVKVNIKAPTSGAYKDIVMFEKEGMSRSNYPFNDSKDSMNFEGVFYLPSRDVIFNGGSTLRNKKMTLVVNTLILNQTRWDLKPATENELATAGPKSIHLIE